MFFSKIHLLDNAVKVSEFSISGVTSILKIPSKLGRPFLNSSERQSVKFYSEKSTHGSTRSVSHESNINVKNVIKINKSSMPSKKETLYIVDGKAATMFATLVANNRTSKSARIIEINSGIGLLTEELLRAGIPSVRMFEGIAEFWPYLNKLVRQYPERLSLEPTDFYHLWNLSYRDSRDHTDKFKTFFPQVPRKLWQEEPAFEIIGALSDANLVHRLVRSTIHGKAFAEYGRTTLYVALPPSVWARLTTTNEYYELYTSRVIFFQSIFDVDVLGWLPKLAFYPRIKVNKKSKSKQRELWRKKDRTDMVLVKIEPKADIFEDDFEQSDILAFWYFVRHNFKARTNRVIPSLETWLPGCGPRLVALGYNIFTEFGELTPAETLGLFKIFKSSPEYKKSIFFTCMDNFLMKMDEHIVFDENSENLDGMIETSATEHES